MRAAQTTVSVTDYFSQVRSSLIHNDCAVFIDGNIIQWGYHLNSRAAGEFMTWLDSLAELGRLLIPAWAVHEYNRGLFSRVGTTGHQDGSAKRLSTGLREFDRTAHLKFSQENALALGYPHREALFDALSSAKQTIETLLNAATRDDARSKYELREFFEHLIEKCAMETPIHETALKDFHDFPARVACRLAPGYADASKIENAAGDLIIWKEILGHCERKRIREAILLTNDQKSDWIYTPERVILANGKTVSGDSESAPRVKLARPDLIAEFFQRTGSRSMQIVSIECAIETLSSVELNAGDAQSFRCLAEAIRVDFMRTPTERVLDWFVKNKDKYKQAIDGVCYWERDPGEVDLDRFKEWTVEEMQLSNGNGVDWMSLFLELFL